MPILATFCSCSRSTRRSWSEGRRRPNRRRRGATSGGTLRAEGLGGGIFASCSDPEQGPTEHRPLASRLHSSSPLPPLFTEMNKGAVHEQPPREEEESRPEEEGGQPKVDQLLHNVTKISPRMCRLITDYYSTKLAMPQKDHPLGCMIPKKAPSGKEGYVQIELKKANFDIAGEPWNFDNPKSAHAYLHVIAFKARGGVLPENRHKVHISHPCNQPACFWHPIAESNPDNQSRKGSHLPFVEDPRGPDPEDGKIPVFIHCRHDPPCIIPVKYKNETMYKVVPVPDQAPTFKKLEFGGPRGDQFGTWYEKFMEEEEKPNPAPKRRRSDSLDEFDERSQLKFLGSQKKK